jgi:hypothetical protein
VTIRQVILTQEFLDRLDMLLPSNRTAHGRPSAQDLLRFELPGIVDKLAVAYERCTYPRPKAPGVRAFTYESALVGLVTFLTVLTDDDVVEVHWPRVHELLE